MDAVKATLTAAGMTMDDLVYVQIFCSDVAHYTAFNAVYRTYFTQLPARAFLGSGSCSSTRASRCKASRSRAEATSRRARRRRPSGRLRR
jgi:enamine deaminase RidA (YjgF/YER057c/UK114 family)